MKKRKMTLIAMCTVAILTLAGYASAAYTWDYAWDADQLPEDFAAAAVFDDVQYLPAGATITRSVSGGIYYAQTSKAINANLSYHTLDGIYDASKESTFELKFKNEDVADRQYYTNCFFLKQAGVGLFGFKFAYNHGSNPYEVNSYAGLYRDAQGFSTVRILSNVENDVITSLDMYFLNGDGNWQFASSSTGIVNTSYTEDVVTFGDIGGNWSGKWSEDYFYMTQQAATLDVIPEPTTIALLAFGGLTLLRKKTRQ